METNSFAVNKTESLIKFIDESPTPHHAVDAMAAVFENISFTELRQNDSWSLEIGSGYFVKNNGSIIAFIVGDEMLSKRGCHVITAHTDSPNLRLKPIKVSEHSGYKCLNIEPYGGVLLNTWLEKDLSVAGTARIRKPLGDKYNFLLKIKEPIARISQLAIHLNRTVNETGLVVNPQTQMFPIIGTTQVSEEGFEEFLRRKAGIPEYYDVLSWDLSLYSPEPSCIGGFDDEFVYASRLDNLASCYAATAALGNSYGTSSVGANGTCIVACFNHEEVGSESDQGATSPFLQDVLERLVVSQGGGLEEYRKMIANSICISSDMAHALNPNYPEKHEPLHAPMMNRGIVLKTNVNQRYATNVDTAAYFIELCKEAEVSYQHFVNRADLACGTTLGPMVASRLGISTVDVGAGMLSMHSVRECAGARDILDMVKVYSLFFTH